MDGKRKRRMTILFTESPPKNNGGEGGIRTRGPGVSGTHDFQSCSFDQLGHLSAHIYYSNYLFDFNCSISIINLQKGGRR